MGDVRSACSNKRFQAWVCTLYAGTSSTADDLYDLYDRDHGLYDLDPYLYDIYDLHHDLDDLEQQTIG